MVKRFCRFNCDSVTVAQRLLGQRLVRIIDGTRLAGIIVETEAYLGATDKAAHTYGGRRTKRNEAMYLPGGHAYVYFTYGMHHCLNVVCSRDGEGVAVLIRAIEPTEGVQQMFARRPRARTVTDLCSGPAKLCQALAIDRRLNALDLRRSRALFVERIRARAMPDHLIGRSPRIGIDSAGEWAEKPLRFFAIGNLHVSRLRINKRGANGDC